MANVQYPSILLEKAVNEFAKLPGIGNELTAKAWELAEAKMTIE